MGGASQKGWDYSNLKFERNPQNCVDMLMQPRMEIALKFIRYHLKKKTSWANAHSKFLTFKCLGITLLVHKYNFMPVKLCHLWHFVADRAKKREEIMCYCDRLFAKKNGKRYYSKVALC